MISLTFKSATRETHKSSHALPCACYSHASLTSPPSLAGPVPSGIRAQTPPPKLENVWTVVSQLGLNPYIYIVSTKASSIGAIASVLYIEVVLWWEPPSRRLHCTGTIMIAYGVRVQYIHVQPRANMKVHLNRKKSSFPLRTAKIMKLNPTQSVVVHIQCST